MHYLILEVHAPSVESPWTQWTSPMDIVWLKYWNKRVDNVEDDWTGQCPLSPWTLSTQFLSFPHTMDNKKPMFWVL